MSHLGERGGGFKARQRVLYETPKSFARDILVRGFETSVHEETESRISIIMISRENSNTQ